MSELTRICVAGDWHGNTAWATSLIKVVSNDYLSDQPYPLFLQLGDFGIWPGVGGSNYREKVSKAITKTGSKLFFIDGNHEKHPWLIDRAKKHTVQSCPEDDILHGAVRCYHDSEFYWLPRGKRWDWHGRKWLALGGATSLDRQWRVDGESWWKEEAITPEQVQFVIDGGHADVMVTHECPDMVNHSHPNYGFPQEDINKAKEHQKLLQKVVDEVKPEYLMHGHFHVQYTRTIDRSWGKVRVDGLDMDGTPRNWCILNIKTMEWEPR